MNLMGHRIKHARVMKVACFLAAVMVYVWWNNNYWSKESIESQINKYGGILAESADIIYDPPLRRGHIRGSNTLTMLDPIRIDNLRTVQPGQTLILGHDVRIVGQVGVALGNTIKSDTPYKHAILKSKVTLLQLDTQGKFRLKAEEEVGFLVVKVNKGRSGSVSRLK